MENRCHVFLLVFVLVAAVNSQSYPRFEFREDVLVNNSYILRSRIGEGHNYSLHCVTDNSDCCSNGEGNWYDETGGEVQQGPDGDSDRRRWSGLSQSQNWRKFRNVEMQYSL